MREMRHYLLYVGNGNSRRDAGTRKKLNCSYSLMHCDRLHFIWPYTFNIQYLQYNFRCNAFEINGIHIYEPEHKQWSSEAVNQSVSIIVPDGLQRTSCLAY